MVVFVWEKLHEMKRWCWDEGVGNQKGLVAVVLARKVKRLEIKWVIVEGEK
jgi:hypothetical protein